MPGLTKARDTSLAEAAAACLEDRQYQPGVQFMLLGLEEEVISGGLFWWAFLTGIL